MLVTWKMLFKHVRISSFFNEYTLFTFQRHRFNRKCKELICINILPSSQKVVVVVSGNFRFNFLVSPKCLTYRELHRHFLLSRPSSSATTTTTAIIIPTSDTITTTTTHNIIFNNSIVTHWRPEKVLPTFAHLLK